MEVAQNQPVGLQIRFLTESNVAIAVKYDLTPMGWLSFVQSFRLKHHVIVVVSYFPDKELFIRITDCFDLIGTGRKCLPSNDEVERNVYPYRSAWQLRTSWYGNR